MIKKIKEAWKKHKQKKKPVIFLSVFSYEPIMGVHFQQIVKLLQTYGRKHDVEFAVFNNTIVKPIEKDQLKQMFDLIYEKNYGKRKQ